jgi:hypothetical protein
MADSSLANGNQQLTEEDYKKLCKQVRHYQLAKKGGKKKAKPILKPIGQTVKVAKEFIVQQNPVDWDDIPNGAPFALDANGTLIYTKAGASRALCLNTMSPLPVGGASVYRVFL